MKSKTNKVILADTDVISHFIVGGEIVSLTKIFPYKVKIVDKVLKELSRFPSKEVEVNNLIRLKLFEEMPFPENSMEIRIEYSRIKKQLFKGDGESACMAIARYTNDIVASSNLKDVSIYCSDHNLTLLTTMDFLCEALKTNLFDLQRCNEFIQRVRTHSRLPVSNMNEYQCKDIVI
jgi:hypothetical protein